VTTSAPATFTPLPLTDTPPTTLTATGTGTVAPTLTPTDAVSVCVNQCAARGWTTYQARRGDTLSRLSVAAGVSMREVQQVNCIADPNRIVVGQGICFPVYPTLPDLAIAVVRTGEQDVGSPYPRFTQFTITVTSVGNAAIAGPVRVISTSPNSTIGSADGAGWRCTVAKMNALDCTFDGSVPVGTALPGIVVAHNDGSVFSAQVSAVGDSNPANNTASDFACTGQRCVELDYWRGQCARNVTPEPDAFHTPAAPDACDRWRNLTGGAVSAD
jgi:LysM repeat protein